VVASRTVGDQWLIESGLQPGDRVIVEGVQKVAPGMPATPIEAGEQPAQAEPAAAASE